MQEMTVTEFAEACHDAGRNLNEAIDALGGFETVATMTLVELRDRLAA